MPPTLTLSAFLRFLLPSSLSSDASYGCEFFCNSRNDRKQMNFLPCPWSTWYCMLEVFFRVFYHPLHRFLQCDRLNKMEQRAIIPDSSIIASNFSKWEGKGPHRTLIFLEHPLLTTSWFRRSLLFMSSSVSFIHSSHKSSISITVTSDSSSSILSSSSTRKSSTMSSFVGDRQTIKYGLLPGHPDIQNPWYCKGIRFVCSVSRFGMGALDLQLYENLGKGALDLISACFASKRDINADLWIYTWEHKHIKGIIQDFSIALSCPYPFCFLKTALFKF